jgi:hydrophobic/amphiphilic exporter-1 (mainly G- bacteria), HAE1 family
LPLGFVKNEFFPKSNSDTMSISVELPSGTNLYSTRAEALKVLDQLADTPETEYIQLDLGSGYSTFGGGVSTENIFNYTLVFKDSHQRSLTSSDIAEILRRQFVNYNKGKLSVNEASGGPPSGADIQIKLFGPDLAKLDNYAGAVENFLKKQPGVTNIDRSIKSGTSKIVFIPDEQKIAGYGLSAETVGFWLRLFATGIKVDDIKLDPDLNSSEDITLRMASNTSSAEDLGKINIPTQSSGPIPLSSLGKFILQPNETLITREDGKRTISVSAGVKKGYTVPQISSKLEAYAKNGLNLTSGYSWSTGGANEQNQNSINSILKAMLISVILIVITMVLQFSSFRKALIVITVIPLSISGVFIIFAITGTTLTFPALIGVLALFGIVVKNSILIVDKITANIATGMEFRESIADAASSRLEPIALTSITAIVGLIPITLSDPLWRGLGGAIIAGLSFSGIIMLFFIPTIYYIIFQSENKPRKN